MSFKVGDEVVVVQDWYKKAPPGKPDYTGCYGVLLDECRSPECYPFFVHLADNQGFRWVEAIAHACPIARESAKLKADVERFEVEINAWIERMRRGEW